MGEGRKLQLVFCCSARDKPEGLGLKDQREGESPTGRLPGPNYLYAVCLSIICLGIGVCGYTMMCMCQSDKNF